MPSGGLEVRLLYSTKRRREAVEEAMTRSRTREDV